MPSSHKHDNDSKSVTPLMNWTSLEAKRIVGRIGDFYRHDDFRLLPDKNVAGGRGPHSRQNDYKIDG